MKSHVIGSAVVVLLCIVTLSSADHRVLLAGEQEEKALTVQELEAKIAELEAEGEENQARIQELEARLDELSAKIGGEEKKVLSNEVDEFLKEEGKKEKQPEETIVFTSPQRQLRELNPEISILGDFFGTYIPETGTDSHVHEVVEGEEASDEHAELKNGFALHEVELSFQAPLDPYSAAKFFVGFHHEGVHVEEAYMEWTHLPARMQLRVGKFRADFGVLNRWHPHAYPTYAVPLPLQNLFGEEGLVGVGGVLTFLLPPLWAHYNEINIEVINGDNERAFSGEGFEKPVGLVHLKNYYDLSNATYLEVGMSGAAGQNDPELARNTYLEGLDLSIVWIPPQRSKYRGVEFRAETFFQQRETVGPRIDTFNLFSFVDIRVSPRWTGGMQFDYVQDSFDRSARTCMFTPFITWWQSEFVRLRFQYEAERDRAGDESSWDHRLVFQSTFALGPHKHEKY